MDTKKLASYKPPKYEITNPYHMAKFATVLKDHILKNKLSVRIVDRDYVMVEGWQFAGGVIGLFSRVIKVEKSGTGWLAQVEIVRAKDNAVVSTGFAFCSKDEMKKKSFDEYAILSMAQTRAIGKAYRNLLGWVMKLAGYEATPAEEMKPSVRQEAQTPVENKASLIMATDSDREMIKKAAKDAGMKEITVAKLESKTGLSISWKDMTKVQASRIIFALNSKK